MGLSLINKTDVNVSDNPLHQLMNKIRQRDARIVIMGAGYVGLTLAVDAARAGFPVACFEIDGEKAKSLAAGKTTVPGVSREALSELVADQQLSFTNEPETLVGADIVVVCVATPLGTYREPDTSQIKEAAECIAPYLEPGSLVILESTSYPGTTEELLKPALEASGLTAEADFWLAFSPERVDPGNTRYNFANTPKVVAGIGPDSIALAQTFYGQMVDKVVTVSSPAAAEMVKLYENIFRNINIAFANEMAVLCERMNLDVWEVIDAAATKPYGFMPFYPGPGPGGHCIPIDPHYLAWRARQYNFHCKFIELASAINEEMPRHVCARIGEALNENGKPLRGSKILLLGAAYKPDIGDVRESPILEIFPLLAKRGAQVNYHDPHVPQLKMLNPGNYEPVALTEEALKEADCVVILTDHGCYPYDVIAQNARLIVDCKNALRKRGIHGPAAIVKL